MKQTQIQQHNPIFNSLLRLVNHLPNSNAKLDSTANYNHNEANLDLEIASDKQNSSDFINSIIHELKTPLNAIIGFSEVLQDDINNPSAKEECLDYIKEISSAANDLNELVHDLLESSNTTLQGSDAQSGFFVDLNQEIEIGDIIKRSIRLNSNYALRRKISLSSNITEDNFIKLDSRRMKQILNNLISNAIKYSGANSEVKISTKIIDIAANKTKIISSRFLEITVSDQGFGMNESQIKTAFEKYKTISNQNSSEVDSLGLGLPITKELVEAQHGTIQVNSQPNKGTQIILTFPYIN